MPDINHPYLNWTSILLNHFWFSDGVFENGDIRVACVLCDMNGPLLLAAHLTEGFMFKPHVCVPSSMVAISQLGRASLSSHLAQMGIPYKSSFVHRNCSED